MTRRSRTRVRNEEGSALVLALLFLTVCAVILGGLLSYANTSASSTTALRVSRNNEYDAQLTMDAAIATIRTGTTCTSSGTTAYTPPTSMLNNSGRALRVDCFAPPSLVVSGQRNDVLLVCPASGSSTPCTDAQSILSANVIFYDSTTPASIGIQTWSNQ